jgi:hypothetical protein
MATLKDVVGKLEENNQQLGNIDKSIDKVEAGLLGLFGLQKRAQLDQLEASREAGQSAQNVETLGNSPKGKGAGGDPDNEGGGLFSGLAAGASGLLGGLTLGNLMRGMVRRSPFLLATVFGDEMASVLEGLGLEKEIAGSIGQGIQAAGIAGLISPRLAPLAGLLGVIIDDKTASALKDIKDDFVKNFDTEGIKNAFNSILTPLSNMFSQLGLGEFDLTIDSIPSFKEVLEWMRTNLIEGVQGLSNILTGEGSLKDIGSAAGVLGAVAFAFAPFKTIALASKIPGIAFLLGKKLLGAVTTLGSLALGLGNAAAAAPVASTASAAASTAGKAAATSTAFKAGRLAGGLLAFATGPVGAAILAIGSVAALGAYVTEATKDAPVIVEMRKRSESIRRKLEAQPGMDMLDEGGLLDVNPANQSLSADDSAQRNTYLKMMALATKNGDKKLYDLNAAALAKLDAKRSAISKPPANGELTNLLSDQSRRQQGQITTVTDASTNISGQSSTAFVGSGTNSFDTNNPMVRRAMEAVVL